MSDKIAVYNESFLPQCPIHKTLGRISGWSLLPGSLIISVVCPGDKPDHSESHVFHVNYVLESIDNLVSVH